eukprot:scaffold324_cov326-Pavlova_lutheri.AAC.78
MAIVSSRGVIPTHGWLDCLCRYIVYRCNHAPNYAYAALRQTCKGSVPSMGHPRARGRDAKQAS